MCDPQWPALQQQFGATGPTGTCAGVIPPPPPEAPAKKDLGGCCDAGGAPASSLALTGLLGALLVRRRQRGASRQLG
jgi:uncharacterized protein (TIGR03382 family)